jgi:hypothetical protein
VKPVVALFKEDKLHDEQEGGNPGAEANEVNGGRKSVLFSPPEGRKQVVVQHSKSWRGRISSHNLSFSRNWIQEKEYVYPVALTGLLQAVFMYPAFEPLVQIALDLFYLVGVEEYLQ